MTSATAALAIAGLLLAGGSAACRPRLAAGGGGAVPRIATISPDSVDTVRGEIVEVTLWGVGFDSLENTVTVGPVILARLPSREDGRAIRFSVPLTVSGTGGAPPVPLRGGPFRVTVTTPRGVSNAVTLTIHD